MVLFYKSISSSAILIAFACCTSFVTITGSPVDMPPSSLSLEGQSSRSARAKSSGLNTELLEKVNVDKYLKNERAVRQQLKCVLRNGPCDSIGKEMKKLMPYMVKDDRMCDDCSPKQLETIQKIIDHLKKHFPAEWAEGVKKYGAPPGL